MRHRTPDMKNPRFRGGFRLRLQALLAPSMIVNPPGAGVKVRRLIPDSIAFRRPLPYAPVMRAAVFLIVLAVSGCVPPATQPLATASQDSQFKEFKARPGVGTLYLYPGVSKRVPGIFQEAESPYKGPVDFYINGEYVGGLNHDQYFALTLKPGTYRIIWKERGGAGVTSDPYNLTVFKGEKYFVRNVFDEGSPMFGLLGALTFKFYLEAAPGTGRQDILSRKLVMANKYMNEPPSDVQPAASKKAGPAERTKSAESVETRLLQLKRLYDSRLITEEEYDRKRRQIIDAM